MSQRLAKIETAISRRKTIEFSYYSMQRDEVSDRKVDPYHLVFRNGQFYLIGHSHERDDVRVFRLSRIRGKVSYATKAEHDFAAPGGLRPPRLRLARRLADGRDRGDGEGVPPRADRLAGRAGLRRPTGSCARPTQGGRRARAAASIYETEYASGRQLISWVLGWRENAELLEPAGPRRGGRRAAGRCCVSATAPTSTSRTRSSGRSPRATAGRARRTAARSR